MIGESVTGIQARGKFSCMRKITFFAAMMIATTMALGQSAAEKKRFFKATRDGDLAVVAALVEKDANWVKVRDEKDHGITGLHVAKTVEIAKCLLDHGAELEALDNEHHATPLRWAAGDGRKEVAAFL